MLGPTTSLLVWAAIHDSCAAAATLLGAKASVNCVDDTGRTPLIWAAAYGHDAVMDVLVDAKADLRPSDHTTALHKAVVRDSVAAVSLLLNKCKAHVDCVNRLHDTPLVYAAEHGNARMVALLVEAKAAVDWDDGTDRTPLVRALWKKHVDVAAVLLLQGKADIKWRNCVLWDPLHHAAENGLVSIMSILVQLGADVESRDCQGRTPLYRAVRGDGRAALSALLKYKADVNVVDRDGVSPLSVAWRADVAAQLLEAKADVHQRDVQGRTVLHQVPPMRTEPIVALLLQAGADAETPDGQGRVPVAYAVDGGCTAALRTLLRCKASANKSFGATGCTPLCYAAQHGRPKEVSVLLEAKAHVNVPDSTGRTPLSYASESYAAERVKADLVKLLVQAGADVCCADDAARASCTAP
jgi:ankyrin repeat protein